MNKSNEIIKKKVFPFLDGHMNLVKICWPTWDNINAIAMISYESKLMYYKQNWKSGK